MQDPIHYFLDITTEVCPMTFVRTKLAIERMKSGECLRIRLQGVEPLANVPKSILELGHDILEILPDNTCDPHGPHLLTLRKKG